MNVPESIKLLHKYNEFWNRYGILWVINLKKNKEKKIIIIK